VKIRLDGKLVETTLGRARFRGAAGLLQDVRRRRRRPPRDGVLPPLRAGAHRGAAGPAQGPGAREKPQILEEAQRRVDEIELKYQMGLATAEERREAIVKVWMEAVDKMEKATMAHLAKHPFNPLYMIVTSKARGSANQVKQLAGMRGPMSDRQEQLPRGADGVRVLHQHARRAQGHRRHGPQDGRVGLPDEAALRRHRGADRQGGGLRHAPGRRDPPAALRRRRRHGIDRGADLRALHRRARRLRRRGAPRARPADQDGRRAVRRARRRDRERRGGARSRDERGARRQGRGDHAPPGREAQSTSRWSWGRPWG